MVNSLSLIVLAALIVGLAAGAAIQASGDPALAGAVSVIEGFGGLWLSALQMTVIPLIVSLLITAIASVADAAGTGRLVGRFVGLFSALLVFGAVVSIAATQGLLTLWPIDRAAGTAFLSGIRGETIGAAAPSFADWLRALAPANPVRAAAEDAVLPLVVFALFFGFAATRVVPTLRDALITFFTAVSETMIVIVRWVLLAGPIGVFALSLGVGLRAGFGAAGVLVHYILVVTAVTIGITLIGVLLALTWGRQPIRRYAVATAPVWAIAFSTQSSLASLPAMLQAARNGLGIPARITDVILPLAVAVFRFTSPATNLAVVVFIAHLYGFQPSMLQYAGAVIVAYGISIGTVGLPGQVSFVASVAPIGLALGVPIDLLGILIAVEIVPDIFRTLGNCAGDIAVTTILNRREAAAPEAPPLPSA